MFSWCLLFAGSLATLHRKSVCRLLVSCDSGERCKLFSTCYTLQCPMLNKHTAKLVSAKLSPHKNTCRFCPAVPIYICMYVFINAYLRPYIHSRVHVYLDCSYRWCHTCTYMKYCRYCSKGKYPDIYIYLFIFLYMWKYIYICVCVDMEFQFSKSMQWTWWCELLGL